MTIEEINGKWGFDTANESIAICESDTSDKIITFIPLHLFNEAFIQMKQNGEILGAYYEGSEVVCKDIDGVVHRNIVSGDD